MAEYINREALIAEYDRVHIGAAGGARKVMVDAPAADVVEVVHGEWVHIKDCGGGKCSGHCSVCWAPQEADNPSVIKEVFRYCRWCGAKMDGDDYCSYGERRSDE